MKIKNTNGKLIIPTIYHIVRNFSEGFAVVGLTKQKVASGFKYKFGLINKQGKLVIPVQFDFTGIKVSNGLLAVRQGDKWGYMKVK